MPTTYACCTSSPLVSTSTITTRQPHHPLHTTLVSQALLARARSLATPETYFHPPTCFFENLKSLVSCHQPTHKYSVLPHRHVDCTYHDYYRNIKTYLTVIFCLLPTYMYKSAYISVLFKKCVSTPTSRVITPHAHLKQLCAGAPCHPCPAVEPLQPRRPQVLPPWNRWWSWRCLKSSNFL